MLQQCKIYITDTDIPKKTLEALHLNYAQNISKALEEIKKEYRNNYKKKHVTIVPDGTITIPKLER